MLPRARAQGRGVTVISKEIPNMLHLVIGAVVVAGIVKLRKLARKRVS
jgi:hypothetical protein